MTKKNFRQCDSGFSCWLFCPWVFGLPHFLQHLNSSSGCFISKIHASPKSGPCSFHFCLVLPFTLLLPVHSNLALPSLWIFSINSTLPCSSFNPYSLLRALFPPFSYLSSVFHNTYRYLCCLCLYLRTLIQMFFFDHPVRANNLKCVNMVQQSTRVTYCTLKPIKSALFRQTTKGELCWFSSVNSLAYFIQVLYSGYLDLHTPSATHLHHSFSNLIN